MHHLLTPEQLDLLMKASPLGIVPITPRMDADIRVLLEHNLLSAHASGTCSLTEEGCECIRRIVGPEFD